MSKLSRREFLKIAGVAAGASVVAACAPQTLPPAAPAATAAPAAAEAPAATAAPAAAAGAKKLELWTFVNTHARWFRAMAEDYKANKDPNFELNVSELAYDDMHDKVQIALQSGGVGAPDLVDIEQGRFGGFLRGGGDPGLVDLKDMLEQGGYLKDLVADREALYSYKGKIYGIEHALCPNVVYYRADILEGAGVDMTKKMTWDDWVGLMKPLCKDDVVATTFPSHEALLRQAGADYFDADGKVTVDSDLSVEVLDWILALRDTHKIALQGPSGDAWWTAVKEGKFFTLPVQADWYAGFLKDYIPEASGKWKASAMPTWKNGTVRTSCQGGTGDCIVKYSKYKEDAWKFQQHSMLSVEGNVRRYLETHLWPPYIPAMSDKRLHAPDEYYSGQDLGAVFADVGPEVPAQYQSPYRSELNSQLSPLWQDIYDGKITPAEALKQVGDNIRKTMADEGAA